MTNGTCYDSICDSRWWAAIARKGLGLAISGQSMICCSTGPDDPLFPAWSQQFLALAHMTPLESLYCRTNVGGAFGFVGMRTCGCWSVHNQGILCEGVLVLVQNSLSPWRSTSLWRASASLKIC